MFTHANTHIHMNTCMQTHTDNVITPAPALVVIHHLSDSIVKCYTDISACKQLFIEALPHSPHSRHWGNSIENKTDKIINRCGLSVQSTPPQPHETDSIWISSGRQCQ